jgi:hypothetical protein
LGIFAPSNVVPAHSLASSLVARYCAGISEDRDKVFTYQVPEPVTAIAALKLAYKSWTKFLGVIADMFRSVVTDVG